MFGKTISAIGSAALTLSMTWAVPARAETYKVGILLPYSGVYAALGNEIEAGFRMALEDFAADLGEHKIEIVREDDEVKPPVGLAKAKKLVLQDKVDVMMGIVSSGVLAGVRDFVHESKVPFIIANAGNDEMTSGDRCSPYLVRVSFSNSQVNRPMGSWLFKQGKKKVWTFGPDYAAGRQQIGAFADGYKAAGGTLAGQSFTPFGKTEDFGPFLTEAKAANPDAIYAFYSGSEAIAFLKQYANFGLNKTIPLYGAGFLTSVQHINAVGDGADGVTSILHYVPSLDNPENKRFQTGIQKRINTVGSEFGVQGYDAGHMLIAAIKATGGKKDQLTAALPKAAFNGPRGPMKIDPLTNNPIQNFYIYETKKSDKGIVYNVKETIPGVQDPVTGCKLN